MIATLNIKQAVQHWLESKSQHRAFRQAVSRAYATFARQYPEWAASYFDEYFLTHDATLLLARTGQGVASPTPHALAICWSRQITWFREETRQQLIAELTPVASDFLGWLAAELPVREITDELLPQPAVG